MSAGSCRTVPVSALTPKTLEQQSRTAPLGGHAFAPALLEFRAAGVVVFESSLVHLSVRDGALDAASLMGTSLEMIERTYGHLVRGADDAFRSRLDAFAADHTKAVEAAEAGTR